MWERVAKYVQKAKIRGWGLTFGGLNDNEHVLRGMVWADNSCLFHDNKERLVCMVNHIIAELLDLDMEANPGSLCRGKKALEVGDGEGERGRGGEGG